MKNLKAKVDRLGELTTTIKKMQSEADELRKELIEQGEGTYEGIEYRAIVSKSISFELDKDKLYQKLKNKYVEVSKPSITEVKKYIPEKELQNYISNVIETLRVIVKKME
jgi:hypothetical protein